MFRVKWNKPSTSKSCFDIFFCHSGLKCGIKSRKELGFGNMVYGASDQTLDFSVICLLEHGKAPDIKRLKQMRRMRRHIKRDDLVLLTISLEVDRVVTFVAIKDQTTIATVGSLGCRPVQVL
ncbi:hypothetical protein HZ326_6046 [Fusarium oxysporum f. sp. albedinis]|nr:hypothetical protein HZ326_6046 [Fusarium oxysporum f. sp. albedinis]